MHQFTRLAIELFIVRPDQQEAKTPVGLYVQLVGYSSENPLAFHVIAEHKISAFLLPQGLYDASHLLIPEAVKHGAFNGTLFQSLTQEDEDEAMMARAALISYENSRLSQ
jgi:hypothetical protein